jgi:hypothetical protein
LLQHQLAISAARIVPSKIFAVVTASVSIVTTPAFVIATSPDNATAASPLMFPQIHFCLQEHYLSLMQYLHNFLVAASCANVGSKTLLVEIPKLHLLLLQQNHSMEYSFI